MIHHPDYRLISLPRVVADLIAGPEGARRLIRPKIKRAQDVEAWLRARAAWERTDPEKIAETARRFLAARWRFERGRLTDDQA